MPMNAQTREFPENWGSDTLSDFIDNANNNVVATFVRDKNEYPLVSSIDEIYLTIARALLNPGAIVESVLLMRAHMAFRAAALLAMAGMNPESFVQNRSCLENALYALHMNHNNGLDEVWLQRHTDDESLRRTRREFTYSKIIETLKAEDARNGEVAAALYERTIDFGAHPNERAVTANLTIEEIDDGGRKLQQTYLSGGTLQQRHSMKTTAQVGLCSLYIIRLIFRERFDILGLTARMDEYRRVL